MNCHVQDREDARLSEWVGIGHSRGIGGDLIPSRDFVGRSLAGSNAGQQRCAYDSHGLKRSYRQTLTVKTISEIRKIRHNFTHAE
jgi:hypothetical protein